MPGVIDIVTGVMQSLVEDTLAASAAATPAAVAPPATLEPSEVAPPADATPTPATPAQAAPTSTDRPTLAEVWNADHASDPYRVYQQMDENGWTAADLAQASGMTEQQAGDWLTRLGAQAGFGGAVTVGRDAIDDPFTTAMTAAQQSGSGPGWVAAAPESRAKDDPDDGGGTPSTAFDVGAFTQWYVSQDTPEAQAFARIQGAFTVDSGVVRFASGATASMQCPDPVTRDTPSPSVPVFSWQADQRVADYQTFAKGDLLSQAGMADNIENAQDDQLIQVFGDASNTLPDNEMGERMRALYGTSLATYMVKLQAAMDAMKSQYIGALNDALKARPTSTATQSPFWIAHTTPGQVHWDGNQGRQVTDPDLVNYTFDPQAFAQWYGQQGEQAQLIQQTFGADLKSTATGFQTTGQLSSLTLALGQDLTAVNPYTCTTTQGWSDLKAGVGVSSAVDVTLASQQLHEISLGSPPSLHDDRGVYFLPGYGFVTAQSNVKQATDYVGMVMDAVIVAAVSYLSAGTLGPAAASAVGGGVAGTVASAAVVGAVATTVSEAMNNDLSLKGILKGALSGALTAGLMEGVQDVTGTLGTAGRIVAQAGVQGTVQMAMGGKFSDGALAGAASGLAAQISGQIDANVADQLAAGQMTVVQAAAARYFGSMFGAAVKIMAAGPGAAGYDLASAFVDETYSQVGFTPEAVAAATSIPTSTSAPAPAPAPSVATDPAPAPDIALPPADVVAPTSTSLQASAPDDVLTLLGLNQQAQTLAWVTPLSSPLGELSDTDDGDTASDSQRQAANDAGIARMNRQLDQEAAMRSGGSTETPFKVAINGVMSDDDANAALMEFAEQDGDNNLSPTWANAQRLNLHMGGSPDGNESISLADALGYGGDPNGGVSPQGLKGFVEGVINGTPTLLSGALKVGFWAGAVQAAQENGDSQDVAWNFAKASTTNWWDGMVIQPGDDLREQGGALVGDLVSPSAYAEGAQLAVSGVGKVADILIGRGAVSGAAGKTTLVPEFVPGVSASDVLAIPKGERPDPSTYLTQDYQDAHAALFQDGVVRIQPSAPSGTIGRTETWVLPKSFADDAISNSGGDVGVLENYLGLDNGYLGDHPVRIDIPNPTGYQIPSGNEFGASSLWNPGGVTSPGGLPEAVIDPVAPEDYDVSPVFGD